MKHSFLRSAAAVAALAAFSFSCSDDETVTPEEIVTKAPLKEYLAPKDLEIQSLDYDHLWSLGYEFKAKRAGSVTALGCAVPMAGKYILELYDTESQELLVKDSVEFSAEEVEANALAFKYKTLATPVELTEGESYRVTYSLPDENTDTFYRIDQQDGFQLPILTDDSSIEIIQGVFGAPETFPDEPWNEVVYLADVKFDYKKQ